MGDKPELNCGKGGIYHEYLPAWPALDCHCRDRAAGRGGWGGWARGGGVYIEENASPTFINVTITNLTVATEIEAQVKADISTALTLYFLSIQMFVTAIDLPSERNDLITDLTISNIVQDILTVNSASAEEVAFDIGAGDLDNYQLEPGELAKLGTVTYA